ncbi:glycerophosphodiester phosphodiesterase family protein [Streptomyces sp. RFCAC02]|uniref:glycerophosphodiester phosphodiesterase family protein n=1 Tax=Streptomyces sp. RFCAC02 TaxID=2499143 RepID=UPI00102182B9|nr:glycerophosphodiester phosphodiesterase family protein [Streptomyces sp. RFCAC02]
MSAHRPRRRAVLGAALAGTAAALTAARTSAPAAGGPPVPAGPPGRDPDRTGLATLRTPAVVAHRGACGYRPEHTIAAYTLGLDLGADMIEVDLVATKDGRLVCRHENEIGGTTDVAEHREFAGRRTTRTVDGERLTGWFTEDFTLEELRTLRAVERLPGRRPGNTRYDGRWPVPTYDEVLDWAADEGRRRDRQVWVCTETKHSAYFRSRGLEIEEPLARTLRRRGLAGADAPVVVQSFEPAAVRRIARLTDNPRVLLIDGEDGEGGRGGGGSTDDPTTPEALRRTARWAHAIGPSLDLVLPPGDADGTGRPTRLVADAHDAGLLVFGYTLRAENAFLPPSFRRGDDPDRHGDALRAARAYYATGIDGLYADQPDTALLAATDLRRSPES